MLKILELLPMRLDHWRFNMGKHYLMKTRIPKRLTTIDIIQQEINTISTWLYVNKLSINITKTKFILLKQKRKNRIIR